MRVIGRKEMAGFEIESACEEDDGEILVIFRLRLRKGRIPGVQVGGSRELFLQGLMFKVLSAQLGLWSAVGAVGPLGVDLLKACLQMQIVIPIRLCLGK